MQAGTYRTICGFCHAACGLVVKIGDHGIEHVAGDPEHPSNRGYICPKAYAAKEVVESPDRLTMPLRKTAGGFKPISWDDALDFAAVKLTTIRKQYGPFSLVRNNGAPVNYEARDGFQYFLHAYGSPNNTGASNTCHVPRVTGWAAVVGGEPEPDVDRARLLIFWAANPLATERFGSYCSYNGFNQILARAKARGTHIVVVDPVPSEIVAHADQWIALKPGTDTALGLAMIHVIINEGLYDKEFVAGYSLGFEELKQHVRPFTPAWAASITGLDEQVIAEFARLLATRGPVAIREGNGLDMYCNVVDAARTVAILVALTGNLDTPGGNVFLPFAKQAVLPKVSQQKRIRYQQFPLFRELPFPAVKESLLNEEDYRPRAMIVHHSNPVLIQANQKRTQQVLEKLDFLMVDDVFMTATAQIADLVLPATSPMERYGYRAYSSFERGFVALGRPVADAPGQARDVYWMEYELARRMGIGGDYPFKDSHSWLEHMLKPSGITLEQLEREQIVYATSAPEYRKYQKNGFQTPSGKVEFVSQSFKALGYPELPIYTEPTGAPVPKPALSNPALPLQCTSRKPSQFVHTKFRNIKTLTKSYPEPVLWVSPQDAAERGICESDMVELSSAQGRVVVRAKLKAGLRPGLVTMDFGWGNPTDGLASSNLLTDDSVWSPFSGTHAQRLFACEVTKMA